MIGTWINIAAILLGGCLGLLLGGSFPERVRRTIMAGLGLFTLGLGIKMFLQTANPLLVLGSLLVGGLLGEWWHIQDGLNAFGACLESRFAKGNTPERLKFISGFLTASLLFCIGPMAILGSIQDGLSGDFQTLAIKAIMDGFAALAFASTLGLGVLFSALPVFIYQGAITLLAVQVQSVMTSAMIAELTAVGGLMLLGIAVSSLLELRPIRMASFLPALLLAPLAVWLLNLLVIV